MGRVGRSAATWLVRLARMSLWIACVLAIVVLGWAEANAWLQQRAITALYAADQDGARGLADRAYADDPEMPANAITRALTTTIDGDWPAAAEMYSQAAAADDMSQHWLGLAQAQVALGRPSADVTHSIERALRIGEQQPSIAFAAGALYDHLGLTERADAAICRHARRIPEPRVGSVLDGRPWARISFRRPSQRRRGDRTGPGLGDRPHGGSGERSARTCQRFDGTRGHCGGLGG